MCSRSRLFSQDFGENDDIFRLVYEAEDNVVTDENGEEFVITSEVPEGVFTTGSLILGSALSIDDDVGISESLSIAESENLSAAVSVTSQRHSAKLSLGRYT